MLFACICTNLYSMKEARRFDAAVSPDLFYDKTYKDLPTWSYVSYVYRISNLEKISFDILLTQKDVLDGTKEVSSLESYKEVIYNDTLLRSFSINPECDAIKVAKSVLAMDVEAEQKWVSEVFMAADNLNYIDEVREEDPFFKLYVLSSFVKKFNDSKDYPLTDWRTPGNVVLEFVSSLWWFTMSLTVLFTFLINLYWDKSSEKRRANIVQ